MNGRKRFFLLAASLAGILAGNGVTLDFSRSIGPDIRRYRTFPPKDAAKWARVCEHVIRHYNEGWDNGFRYDIAYWPIWHAPDRATCWAGTADEFVDFYAVASRHLKTRFPSLKIGGYGCTGFGGTFAGQPNDRARYLRKCFGEFLDYVKRNDCPVDFFSYHCYGDASKNDPVQRFVRQQLDDAGFRNAELHNTEWKSGWGVTRFAHQAAQTAATLVAFQNGPVDVAAIYDGRCGPGDYCPLFNPSTLKPHKAYYAFRMFNELYRDGSAVKTAADATSGLRLAASVDGKGRGHALYVNEGGKSAPLASVPPGWRVAGCRALDETHDDEPVSVPSTILPDQVLLVTFERE